MKLDALNRIFGGALLVAGTCIGAGMLSLPISTAAGGFYASVGAFFFCWVMMTLTAFLMLEISLCYPEETNLITMAKTTLGKGGAILAWVCYLLFLYSLMGAYTSGASGILAKVYAKCGIPDYFSLPTFVGFFALIVYLGTRWVDGVNRVMMIGLIVAYLALVGITAPRVEWTYLQEGNSKYLWVAGPLLVTSFGFHLLIPSLKNYMHGNVKELRFAIFWGSLIPLIVYLFWEFIILGTVPSSGTGGLIAMNQTEQPVVSLTHALSVALSNPWITLLARVFGFCAILTSFIGVALGLFDFLADGFHIEKNTRGKLLLALLTFAPPACFVIFYPSGFLLALRYAGVFASILLILYPAIMVWRNRYYLKSTAPYRVIGGRISLILAILFGAGVICLELLQDFKLLPMAISTLEDPSLDAYEDLENDDSSSNSN